jgi:hypothetical protein
MWLKLPLPEESPSGIGHKYSLRHRKEAWIMPMIEITNYTCVWDLDDREGHIGLFHDEEYQGGASYRDPNEFSAVMNILRNEKPVYFDTENQWLMAGVAFSEEVHQLMEGDSQ